MKTKEHKRLLENSTKEVPLEKWGPYLSERQWGTVREDYSESGGAWNYFPHDDARSRAYRWGEDGIHGWCDTNQFLCLAMLLLSVSTSLPHLSVSIINQISSSSFNT